MRRLAWLPLAAILLTPRVAEAQYFGQNKIQYSNFDFKVLQTEHFDVYYYPVEREAVYDVARMAERSYARLSTVLRHQFTERKPIVLYASHSDFVQTNISQEEVGEGTGGFTDFLKHRNVIPLTGSYADIEHVLQHEMTHQFQYDVWSGGRAGGGMATITAINPPLWFVEGMAEYFSIGSIDANTAMWLRDAAAQGKLPTIHQLETDPRIFPYRFGQAIVTYIGQRWGDEAIATILQNSRTGSLEAAFRRVIGLDFRQLGDQWRDAVQKEYLPELTTRVKASAISQPVLTKARSEGTLHLAPALSPDGKQVAYFSEKNFYFVDLWLADVASGKPIRRLLKSSWSSNYETFRFINSSASWSPDGQYLAFAAKRGPKDDIVILDVKRNKEVNHITLQLSGVTTPSWSPDGQRLVFTGYDGGLSDLFVIDRDGKNLTRLTEDKYADFHPQWSPDGSTIAFTTDRGPETDFTDLKIGNFRLALYHLDSGRIDVLQGMEYGKNTDPQWAPDGQSIAYVSDRGGVSDLYLYDLGSGESYQITNLFTGAQGITPLSPILSWAAKSDKLAYVYYEQGNFDVYVLDNPRSLKKEPWRPAPVAVATADSVASQAPAAADSALGANSAIYRSALGFRRADSVSLLTAAQRAYAPISMRKLMDSTTLGLPDTSTFTQSDYHVHFTPDYVARPSIGYARDNFGRGFFGGTTVSLSDMLGGHQMVFSGYVNGRIDEAQVLAAYANLSHRFNYAVGVSQTPYYFYQGSGIVDGPSAFEQTYIQEYRRLVLRSAFAQGAYPLSRFQRVEAGLSVTDLDDAIMQIARAVRSPVSGLLTQDPYTVRHGLQNVGMVQPSLAMVFDNSLSGYVGPMLGRRSRFEISPTVGGWRYLQLVGDYRRYDKIAGPFTLATRLLYYGRSGRDAQQFQMFLGYPDLLRGHTSGSYSRNECAVGTGRPQFGHRMQRARSARRQLDRRGERRDPRPGHHPGPGYLAGGRATARGRRLLRRGRGMGRQQQRQVVAPSRCFPRGRPRAVAVSRRLGPNQPLRFRDSSLRLRQAASSPGREAILDHLLRAGVLIRDVSRHLALLIGLAASLSSCSGPSPKATLLAATPLTGESVLRLAHGGGTATLLRADLSANIDYRISGVPAIRRTLVASLEDKTVYALDTLGRLINLDLLAGRCCTLTVRAHGFTGSASGEVFGFDSTRRAIRLSNRTLKTYRTPLIAGEVALLRGPGSQVIVLARNVGTAQVIGDDGELRRLKIPDGELSGTWYGDLFAVVTPSGLELFDPTGKRPPQVIAMRGTPLHSAFSPSGHRIYVARQRGDLVQLDRFTGTDLGSIPLPGVASALRADRTGRWLLARAGTGDSIWVIDATSWKLATTVQAPWGDDLPAITAGKNLLIRRGKDVVTLDLSTPQHSEIARLAGAAADLFLPLAWVPKNTLPDAAPQVATTAATAQSPDSGAAPLRKEPNPTAGAGPGFLIQISSSQNEDWAKALAQQLKDGGYPARVLGPDAPDQGYRVVVGPYPSRDEADSAGKRLGRSYFILSTGTDGN